MSTSLNKSGRILHKSRQFIGSYTGTDSHRNANKNVSAKFTPETGGILNNSSQNSISIKITNFGEASNNQEARFKEETKDRLPYKSKSNNPLHRSKDTEKERKLQKLDLFKLKPNVTRSGLNKSREKQGNLLSKIATEIIQSSR